MKGLIGALVQELYCIRQLCSDNPVMVNNQKSANEAFEFS
jgi:hypothetical protein